jgi:hypothetical protein
LLEALAPRSEAPGMAVTGITSVKHPVAGFDCLYERAMNPSWPYAISIF